MTPDPIDPDDVSAEDVALVGQAAADLTAADVTGDGSCATTDTTASAVPVVVREGSRVMRARMPLAPDVVEAVAVSHGVCIHPVTLRVTDMATGEETLQDVPCGATLDAKCPPCAKRSRALRIAQCRTGWHLEADPIPPADDPNEEQQDLALARAEATKVRDDALDLGADDVAAAARDLITEIDAALRTAGVRGDIDPPPTASRRVRSTKRRQDAPDLPRRASTGSTVGRFFTGHDGTVFRPSMFVTLTLPSYGAVHADGTPRDPGGYDYVAAARDALAFSRLVDRFAQNLRRVAGYDVQYFATVEPQRRLALHVHLAIRGTIPRALLRQVVAATYHQVWWPPATSPRYDETHLPTWSEQLGAFTDPATGVPLPSWEDALDDLDLDAELHQVDPLPRHVARFGSQVDVQGLLGGSPEADRRVGYLVKYLTKSIADCHTTETVAERAHLDRLHAVLTVEPCSPQCANWLRYGITPKGAHAGIRAGFCRSKAHKREHLGYSGRRVLVSRKWSGKTLTDHKADRRAWVLSTLGIDPDSDEATATDKTSDRYAWQATGPTDDIPPLTRRLLHAIAERIRWRAAYQAALTGDPPPTAGHPATRSATDFGEEAA